ncbi:cutinase family protein [Auraticoccus monumenti]|uniref:Cutinase n=1 Tax=Auraticoccus monumenti TaxID=675864 RepID=A0A1G6WMH7_9ACTN|nr:cutinase family protein [Auraticoccus monumenti]SDD66245.1 Cutinase [Auraticoccus monumenti]
MHTRPSRPRSPAGSRRRLARSAAVLLAGLLLATSAAPTAGAEPSGPRLDWRPGGPTASSRPGAPCADLLFVGARGSGEDPPYGRTVERTRQALADAAADGTGRDVVAREVWLDFPAVDPHTLTEVGLDRLLLEPELPTTGYLHSVDIGVQQLSQVLDDSAARCPDERWVLAGFSQGAQVVTSTLSRRTDDWRLAGAVLVGDPALHPGQAVVRTSTAVPEATGLVATLRYVRDAVARGRDSGEDPEGAATMVRSVIEVGVGETDRTRMLAAAADHDLDLPVSPVVVSVCRAGDLVCDAGPALLRMALGQSALEAELARTRPVHGGYRAGDLRPAARAIVSALPERLPPPAPAPPAPEPVAVGAETLVAAGLGVLGVVLAAAWWWRRRRTPRSTSGG